MCFRNFFVNITKMPGLLISEINLQQNLLNKVLTLIPGCFVIYIHFTTLLAKQRLRSNTIKLKKIILVIKCVDKCK